MDVRLTVSLLDAAGAVVAWAFVLAAPRGDGGLWPLEPLHATIERETDIVEVVAHWADLHVGARAPLLISARPVGMGITVPFTDALIRFATPTWDVPCVTVRGNAAVGPAPGRVGGVM